MAEKVLELTNGEFDKFIKEGTALVDFSAEWCMPCLMMAPILEDLSERFSGKIKFGKIDVDSNREIAQKFQVSSIPNLILFKKGKPVERFVGLTNAEDLEEKLKVFI
ncbi:MAG: thioredoxin [Candidatus ainarchaeum sp.]|nr:thioredoxin [Candidatus ainarchaeum sp.]